MARLHLLLRPLIVATWCLAATSCADDLVEVPESLRGEPACMWIIDSWVHFADGSMRMIFDESAYRAGVACVCMTEEDFEAKARVDELNDMALEICEELADQHEHEWNECQDDHDEGAWRDILFWARGNWEHPAGTALHCAGE